MSPETTWRHGHSLCHSPTPAYMPVALCLAYTNSSARWETNGYSTVNTAEKPPIFSACSEVETRRRNSGLRLHVPLLLALNIANCPPFSLWVQLCRMRSENATEEYLRLRILEHNPGAVPPQSIPGWRKGGVMRENSNTTGILRQICNILTPSFWPGITLSGVKEYLIITSFSREEKKSESWGIFRKNFILNSKTKKNQINVFNSAMSSYCTDRPLRMNFDGRWLFLKLLN